MVVSKRLGGAVLVIALSVALGFAIDAIRSSDESQNDVASTTTTTTTVTTTTTTTTTTVPPGDIAVETVVSELDLRALAQQVVVFSTSGIDPAQSIVDAFGDVCLGGVFVSSSFEIFVPGSSLDAASDAISGVMNQGQVCDALPLIATDAEAGTTVLRVPITPLPEPGEIEASYLANPQPALTELADQAEAFAAELSSIGVTVNFGVVGDVDVADDYYMAQRGRTFGSDPTVVAAISETLVAAHCRANVAATIKHFPNQGSTPQDPHRLDSFSANDLDAWTDFGQIPYRLTEAPLVMVGHIRYTDVDDAMPATLSPTIVTGWLRSGLGYDGVIITDDLSTMRGVDDLPPGERAVAALRAGSDLALFVDIEHAEEVMVAIEAELAVDSDFEAQLRASVDRVVRLKGALGLLPDADPSWFSLCG